MVVACNAATKRYTHAGRKRLWSVFACCILAAGNGAEGQSLTPPKVYLISPTGVNILEGSYTYSNLDLSIGTLTLERSHLGGPEASSGYFSATWTHNWDMRVLVKQTGTVYVNTTVVLGRKKYHYLGQPSTGAVPDPDANGTSIVGNVFTDRDGTKYIFGIGSGSNYSGNRVGEIDSPNGTIIKIAYLNSVPRLITSNNGYAILLESNGYGLVTTACGFNLTQSFVSVASSCASAPIKVSYTYASLAPGTVLTSFTDARGYVSTISYNPTNYLGVTCISTAGSATCPITNSYDPNPNAAARVAQQTTADGMTWQFLTNGNYLSRNDGDPDTNVYGATTTAPDGGVTHYGFNGLGALTNFTDANGNLTTQLITSGGGTTPINTTLPEGNVVEYKYNGRLVEAGYKWTAKPGSGQTDIIIDAKSYPSTCENQITCNLPDTVTDANGNVTRYTYDPVHGGVLTKISPPDASGISAEERYAYVQRYAWITNGAGYTTGGTPIWLLAEERTCRTSATVGGACAAGSADEVVTTYEYGADAGPNNLLRRGVAITADGITRRTCYGYDWQGNKISETKPRAALAVCS